MLVVAYEYSGTMYDEFTGLIEPAGRSGRRQLVLVRWTDAVMGQHENLPASHPLHAQEMTVTVRLSARSTHARPGATLRMVHARSGKSIVIGRLPSDPDAVTAPIPVHFAGPGANAIVIE